MLPPVLHRPRLDARPSGARRLGGPLFNKLRVGVRRLPTAFPVSRHDADQKIHPGAAGVTTDLSEEFDNSEDSLKSLIGGRVKILNVGSPTLYWDSQWAVGRVGKITRLTSGKDHNGKLTWYLGVTLWYRRRGGDLKSEFFELTRAQIEVLPDRRRKKKKEHDEENSLTK
jgi:hypothetical protein